MAKAKKDGVVLPFRRKGGGNGGGSNNGNTRSPLDRKDFEKEADGTKVTGRSGCRSCGGTMACEPNCATRR
jgi:hypothetical protein